MQEPSEVPTLFQRVRHHDLRYVVSSSRSRIRFRLSPFRPTMFHRLGYRPEPSSTNHACAHIQGSLLQWGTHTPNDRLKLSSEPRISTRSQVVQASPPTSDAFLRPQQPTGAVQVAPFGFRTPPGTDFHRFTLNRVWLGYPSARFRVAQPPRPV